MAKDTRKTVEKAPPASSLRAARRTFLLPAAITAAAMCFVAVRFFAAASETLSRTRENACRSLQPDPLPEKLRNAPAPDFELTDATGHKVSLSAQRGHPVAVNFWATWCPPCVEEVPSLEAFANTIEGTDMRLLAVSVDDGWEPIRKFFVKGTKIGVLLDESHTIPKTFGTTQYPETYFVDPSGHVRYYFANSRNWATPEAVACLESLR
ncbi:MAG TPA: TlpA disulfide reductase family protein [Polyangia bacterium]|nr:TlpA disulfide reductase family protein [Polyangia bacterium]